MRILAIRGRNLASLTEFEIDLTREPLAGTGLFAITGDTGAGKSTILDAMCLALYGEHPRSRVGRNEPAPDPGSELQASDARNILRRGAGEGMAEVDFIGQDAVSYRATWIVRRANGKATGKLQKVDRKLDLLDGSGNVAVGIKAVDAAVVERTGFTFDQFGRTVLLAQGEFDRFLLASEAERADLLERITGTAIYSRISRRVHEETAERERVMRDHMARRDAIEQLSDEARAEVMRNVEAASTNLTRAAAEFDGLEARIRDGERLQRLHGELAAAERSEAENRRSFDAAQGDRLRLQAIGEAEPLRALLTARDVRRREEKEAGAAVAQLSASITEAESKRAIADSGLQTAAKQLRDADGEVRDFAPAWTAAANLDRDIEAARREHVLAEAAALDAARARDAIHREVDALERREAEARSALTTSEVALAARRHLAALHDSASDVDALLVKRTRLLTKAQDAARRRDDAQIEAQRITQDTADLHARIDVARRETDTIAGELGEARRNLDAMDAAALEARDEHLRRNVAKLESARDLARRRDEALQAAVEARRNGDGTIATQRTIGGRQAEVRIERRAVESLRADAARLAELADASSSAHAAHLRASLAAGEPCPVCGAKDHPFAAAADAASTLAGDIRARRDAVEERCAALSAEAVDLEGRMAAATAALAQADRTAQTEAARATAFGHQLAAIELAGIASDPRAVALLAGHTAAAIPLGVLDDLAGALAAARTALEAERRAAANSRNECISLEQRIAHLEAERRRIGDIVERDAAKLPALVAAVREHAAEARLFGEQLNENASALAPHLHAAGLAIADCDSDPDRTRASLMALAAEYGGLLAEHDTARQVCADLAPQLIDARQRWRAAGEGAASAANGASQRAAELHRLEAERAPMLGGEATDAHRQRFVAAAATAGDAHARAEAAARDAGSERDRLIARQDPMIAAAQRAADLHQQAERALADALASCTRSEAELRTLLDVPAAERTALARAVADIERLLAAASQLVATRRDDLALVRSDAGERDAGMLDALRQERAEAAARRDAATRDIAVLRKTLDDDDGARARVMQADAEMAGLLETLQVWRDVDAAIGHGDGVRFKRFAQGVTLANLVGLANRELAALNPRYALRQGATSDLALDVVDREMGEDVRSPRTLSGGERFLVSLALALALAGLEGRQSFVDTLFIDEGFGGLDPETLDMAIDALEGLQGQGRKVGVITHVGAMIERIAIQVRVEKRGRGRSVVSFCETGLQRGC